MCERIRWFLQWKVNIQCSLSETLSYQARIILTSHVWISNVNRNLSPIAPDELDFEKKTLIVPSHADIPEDAMNDKDPSDLV